MRLEFAGELWYWRGPSPYHFVTVPDDGCAELRALAPVVSYGWGMIPVAAQIGETRWTTSLFPKDGGYVVRYAIADVMAFLTPGDPVDQEALRRGESLYGADSKVPLHPSTCRGAGSGCAFRPCGTRRWCCSRW